MFSSLFPGLFALLAFAHLVSAQTPRLWLKFDGNLTDSGAGVITSITPNNFTPVYTTDRNGVAGKALQFPSTGSASLLLQSTAFPGDSNQALGLKGAAVGSTTSNFTMAAWVLVNSVSSQGYNTIFGNAGSGAGTLHAGLNNNSDKAHFGFDNSNDANGAVTGIVANKWYHLAFVYEASTTTQRIYINGIPEIVRTGATNTVLAADLLLGNWGTTTSATNDLRGSLDDVVVYNSALKGDQVLALANGVDPSALPATGAYFPPPTTYGVRGTAGQWGVREILNYTGIAATSMVNVDRILKAQSTTPGGTAADYYTAVINAQDDEDPSPNHFFDNKGDFGTNTSADDNNFCMLARCSVRIPVTGSYTFGFRSDDGARLRIVGKAFASSTQVGASNVANPANAGDVLIYPNGTTDSATLGVVTLPAGDYALEFTYFENTGTSGVEVFAAAGAKTAFDSSFQLIGNTAAGGLEIVQDAAIIPAFTVNSGSSVFVQNGTPSAITLAWTVLDPNAVLTIDQGINSVSKGSGTLSLPSPTSTTTYTMTSTNGTDTATRSVTVLVNAAPQLTLTANRTGVVSGGGATLSWTSAGATSLTLNPGNINVTSLTSKVVNPTATTTYTLTAANGFGSTPLSVTINVGLAPVISGFTTTDANPVYGKNTALSWAVTGADTQSIDQGIGTVAATGSVYVVPLLTTTYTLTATNVYGTSTATRAITLATPIGVASPGFVTRRVSSTVAFPFPGQGYLQSATNLLAGQNAGATSSGTYTTINFLSGGSDGDFTSGNSAFPGGTAENYAVEITGTLIVNTPGEYTFVINSDDGCNLKIDGVDVIVDDANHSPTQVTGKVTLIKPTAQFRLIYYNATNGGEVEASWQRPNLSLQQLGVITASAPLVRNGLLISEFCASNSSSLLDEDGASSDWIEIWNSTNAAVSLSGCYLSTSASLPTQWALPAKTLAAGEYLIVFASGKNRSNPVLPLHTNFTLVAAGGYLSLKKDNGAGGYTVLSEFNPYPAQTSDITYGSSDAEGYVGFMEVPTPGYANSATYTGFIAPVVFSQARGRMAAPINLTLTCATPGAVIRYTTDGSEPSFGTGNIYSQPLPISSTTIVRASAYLDGWKPPVVATNSYLYLDDIITQSTATAIARGWPGAPVNGQVYRFGMNLLNVTSAGGDAPALKAALSAAPTVCLNLKPDDFFGVTNGIYSNPAKRGRLWERSASLEYINADGTSGIQDNCGVRVRGNASRAVTNPKHGFHLYFRSQYGGGSLQFPLFGTEGAQTKFSQIDMRCEENNSWSKDNSSLNTLMREEWSRKSQGDLGQPYSRNGYFHLYINGVYWGIFDWEEKTEADFAANLFGGDDSDYDTVKSSGSSGSYLTEMTDGNFIAWQQLFNLCLAMKAAATETDRTAIFYQMMGLNTDGTRNAAYPVLLNTANLVDYLLVVFYNGSFDSPMSTFLVNASNNWFGVRRRDGTAGGWLFFCHDEEHGMGTATQSYNRVGPWGDPNATGNNWGQTWTTAQYRTRETFTRFNPHYLHEFLCLSAEYRQAFNDRVHRNYFGNGALTATNALGRITNLAAQVDPIIHAEAARWGSSSLNRTTWLNAKAAVNTYINTGGTAPSTETKWPAQARTTLVLEQLKAYTDNGPKPLYFATANPDFSNQAGGLVSAGFSFQITNPNTGGKVYYTTDGSDPRALGGGPGSTATLITTPFTVTIPATQTIRARVYDDVALTWSGDTTQTYVVGIAASAANIVVSKLQYNPPTGSSEYLELMNISASTVVMTGCNFTKGVTFTFPTNYSIPPGGRCLVVGDTVDSFLTANPTVAASAVAGQFAGKLDNSGEKVTLVTPGAVTIKSFTYSPDSPWPPIVSTGGPCLILLRPETNPDHTLPANWRGALTTTGAPAAADGVRLAAWLSAYGITASGGFGDKDGDGLPDFLEYALGLNPGGSNGNGLVTGTVTVNNVDYLSLTLTHPLGRDDVTGLKAEACTTLSDWVDAILLSTTPSVDGQSETLVYRHPHAKSADGSQYMRVKVTK